MTMMACSEMCKKLESVITGTRSTSVCSFTKLESYMFSKGMPSLLRALICAESVLSRSVANQEFGFTRTREKTDGKAF